MYRKGASTAEVPGNETSSLQSVEDVNQRQKRVLVDRLVARLGDDLTGKTVDEARHHLWDRVTYAESNYAALEGANALVIHTEWQPYRRPDFARMKAAMKAPLVFDGRNLWDPADMAERGFEYSCIGRGAVVGWADLHRRASETQGMKK